MRKKSKKYVPNKSNNKLEGSVFLKAFLCDHDSFITIDNLMHKIKNLCKLDYKQGVGYVMKNELGEEIKIIDELNIWRNEWRTLATNANINNYSDESIISIIKKLSFNLDISDELIEAAEKEINFQRAIYRTLSTKPEGKAIIEDAIRPRVINEEIRGYLA